MKKKGQSFLEYSILIGCVAMTIFAMQTYFKRGIQGIVKSASDQFAVPAELSADEAQMRGERESGWTYYAWPTTIAADQEIITNEYASGDRRFRINRDSTVTDAHSMMDIPPATYLDTKRISGQASADKASNVEQKVTTSSEGDDGLLTSGQMRAVLRSGGTFSSPNESGSGGGMVATYNKGAKDEKNVPAGAIKNIVNNAMSQSPTTSIGGGEFVNNREYGLGRGQSDAEGNAIGALQQAYPGSVPTTAK
jgi:hypothetical protein